MLRLRRRKGSRNYYLRGTILKRYVDESTGTSDRDTAEAVRIQREKEILDRRVHGRKTIAKFEEALILYLEAAGERRFTAKLLNHFAGIKLKAINQAAADRAALKLFPKASPATRIRQVYGPLSAIINHAALSGICHPVRFKRPRVTIKQRPSASPEDLANFCTDAPERVAALAIFMAYTGRRIGEAVALYWQDVDLENRSALIRKTKNRRPATVYLSGPVLEVLANLKGKKKRGKVFGYAGRSSVYRPWREACEKAGVNLTPHEMGRHTFGTWGRRYAGMDLKELMVAGGWDSIQSVVRYANVTDEEVREAVDKYPNPGKIRASDG